MLSAKAGQTIAVLHVERDRSAPTEDDALSYAYPPPSGLRDTETLLQSEVRELRAENVRLINERKHRLVDSLTGLCGRRYFDRRLRQELSRADRHELPLSLVIVDIADLRGINERVGEDVGDNVLRWVADLLAYQCRETDVPCRIGGDEFAIILAHTPLGGAQAMIDRVAASLRRRQSGRPNKDRLEPVPCLPKGMAVELSFGLGAYPEPAETLLELVFEAEGSMYEAKKAGPKSERCVVAA